VGQLVYNEATIPCEMPHESIFSWGGSWDINYNLILGGVGTFNPKTLGFTERKAL
jgi:hypothetical protein